MTPPRYLNEVWSYSLTCPAWTQLSPEAGPSPRVGHAMAYDSARDRVLVFGGQQASGDSPLLSDLWALSLQGPAWTQLMPGGTAPAARHEHQVAYDSGRDRLLLYGGNTGLVLGDVPVGTRMICRSRRG